LKIRFQADADLNHSIVSATRQREPAIDFLSAADAGLEGIGDAEVLNLAARQGRILISHDRRTMPLHFRNLIEAGQKSPGLFIVSQRALIRPVVEAIVLIWAASTADDWTDQIYHLPSLARHLFR
jgi:predicted nuclease of predicted toxin-antitoxin system